MLSRAVLGVLDDVLALPPGFTRRSLSVTPHTYEQAVQLVKPRHTHAVLSPHRGAFGCGSGPGARVCPPRWTEGPATLEESTPSLAGSEEREEGGEEEEKNRIKSAMTATL